MYFLFVSLLRYIGICIDLHLLSYYMSQVYWMDPMYFNFASE